MWSNPCQVHRTGRDLPDRVQLLASLGKAAGEFSDRRRTPMRLSGFPISPYDDDDDNDCSVAVEMLVDAPTYQLTCRQ